jgi:hypothetical protein
VFVKRIEIGQKCKEKTQFAQYEIVVNFEDDVSDVETVNPPDILERINLWESVKDWDAAKAQQYMTESLLGLRFAWPKSAWGRPLKVKSYRVFYYDVYGVKHYTILREE